MGGYEDPCGPAGGVWAGNEGESGVAGAEGYDRDERAEGVDAVVILWLKPGEEKGGGGLAGREGCDSLRVRSDEDDVARGALCAGGTVLEL